MTIEDTSASAPAVPVTSEAAMWAAELSVLPEDDPLVRFIQFAIRTAVRAQALAAQAHTDPIDELLDARAMSSSEKSRQVYDTAIGYLRMELTLSRGTDWHALR